MKVNRMPRANTPQWFDALQLSSASLPIGGFAYSQGLEQACELGKVHDADSAQRWIEDYLLLVIQRQELPWWHAIMQACQAANWPLVIERTEALCALRETAELRLESAQMGHAMVRLFDQWLLVDARLSPPASVRTVLARDYTAAHAALCAGSGLDVHVGMAAWLWSWLDNQVLAAVKLVPLGQRHGQQILHHLKKILPEVIERAVQMPLSRAGTAAFGLMQASARHETQYARLFRS